MFIYKNICIQWIFNEKGLGLFRTFKSTSTNPAGNEPEGNNLHRFKGFFMKATARFQGQNLVVTVVYAPHSLDSGAVEMRTSPARSTPPPHPMLVSASL